MAEYTNFEVEYVLDDRDISDYATITTEGNNPKCTPQLLKIGSSVETYMSTEHNFSLLDGNRPVIGDMLGAIGFISTVKSNSNGTFSTSPIIKCTFSEQHTVPTISFKFLGDVPTKVRFIWGVGTTNKGSLTTSLLKSKDYYNAYISAQDVTFIDIEFLEALPDRFVAISKINFGGSFIWDETFIKSATLVKGFNRLSNPLSVDTLNFELVDKDGSLDLSNNGGILSLFVRENPIYPKEYVDDKVIDLGVFYLDTFTSATTGVATVSATSIMGLLDRVPYDKGVVVVDGLAGHSITDILQTAGITNFVIDAVTYSSRLNGTIKPTTCRQALADVLFACNSVIDASDPRHVVVKKFSDGLITDISRHNKVNTSVTSAATATTVKLTYTKFNLESETSELYRETLNPGRHHIQVTECSAYQTITGASFVTSPGYGTCVFDINVTTRGEVVIKGNKFSELEVSVSKSRELKYGELENVIEYSTSLCDNTTADALLEKLFNWHQRALEINIQHYAEDVEMDGSRIIQNPNEEKGDFIGLFSERSFDLTGGFLDSATLIGYFDPSSTQYYATSGDVGEMYASDNVII